MSKRIKLLVPVLCGAFLSSTLVMINAHASENGKQISKVSI